MWQPPSLGSPGMGPAGDLLLGLSKEGAAEKEFPCSLACDCLTPMTQQQVLGTSVMAREHAQLVTDLGWLPGAHATLPATPEPVLSWIQLPTATLTFSWLLPSGQGGGRGCGSGPEPSRMAEVDWYPDRGGRAFLFFHPPLS